MDWFRNIRFDKGTLLFLAVFLISLVIFIGTVIVSSIFELPLCNGNGLLHCNIARISGLISLASFALGLICLALVFIQAVFFDSY